MVKNDRKIFEIPSKKSFTSFLTPYYMSTLVCNVYNIKFHIMKAENMRNIFKTFLVNLPLHKILHFDEVNPRTIQPIG